MAEFGWQTVLQAFQIPAFSAFAAAMLIAVVGLLLAEWAQSGWGRWATKPLASLAFLGAVWSVGAFRTEYGIWVFAALTLSALGDVLLIPRNDKSFLAGLVSFLLGHVAYIGAFWVRGVDPVTGAATFGVLLLPGLWMAARFLPRIEREMRLPVFAYGVVISVMVAAAVGSWGVRPDAWLVLGAVSFYLSDLSVARDQFFQRAFINRAWGLPAYYGGQLLLAATVLGG